MPAKGKVVRGQQSSRAPNMFLAVIALVLVAPWASAPRAWAAGKYRTLHRFTLSQGNRPIVGLVLDGAGNLYGTTTRGAHNRGGVFELTPTGDGKWKEHVLHSFNRTDGVDPFGNLVFDSAGNLYGTTFSAGAHNSGTVFELTPTGDGKWAEQVLHSFSPDGKDGFNPSAGLIFDSTGSLYGTTQNGGAHYYGSVFKLTLTSDGKWKERVLHSFNFVSQDGAEPTAGVVFDSTGNLYGTTSSGGTHGEGTVFELTPTGGGNWTERVLHSFNFDGTDGSYPRGGLVLDSAGNLYGTTVRSGTHDGGTVFELTPNGDGKWTEEVLYSFNGNDGDRPESGLVFDSTGSLYGTTPSGGDGGAGVVFKLAPDSHGGWNEAVVHSFFNRPGFSPIAGVVSDPSGNLYGTTPGDDVTTFGSVYEITP